MNSCIGKREFPKWNSVKKVQWLCRTLLWQKVLRADKRRRNKTFRIHNLEVNIIRYFNFVDWEEVYHEVGLMMCQFHIHIFIVRPVSAIMSSSVTDNLKGKGEIIPS